VNRTPSAYVWNDWRMLRFCGTLNKRHIIHLHCNHSDIQLRSS
jgi:hypothetical protein